MFAYGNSFLSQCGVSNEQDFVRCYSLADTDKFLDHGFVDLKPSGRIDDDHIIILFPGIFNGIPGDGSHIDAGPFHMDGDIDLPADDLKLVDSGGTVNVSGDQQDFFTAAPQIQCEFTGSCRFTAAVKTGEHNDTGAVLELQL